MKSMSFSVSFVRPRRIMALLLFAMNFAVIVPAHAQDAPAQPVDKQPETSCLLAVPYTQDELLTKYAAEPKHCEDFMVGRTALTFVGGNLAGGPAGGIAAVVADEVAYANWIRVIPKDESKFADTVLCSPSAYDELKAEDTASCSVKSTESWVIWMINSLLDIVASIGNWFLWLFSWLFIQMVVMKSFVTNPYVQYGWPVIQGFVNIGFIIALLLIAVMTLLRLDSGGGVKKMLPRLLISALLVNFSLVIGGIFIDSSRILMAIMVDILAPAGTDLSGKNTDKVLHLQSFGVQLLLHSSTVTAQRNPKEPNHNVGTRKNNGAFTEESVREAIFLQHTTGDWSWSGTFQILKATMLIWALAIAFMFISIGLFARYIILLILLIFSAAPFLAIALPGAKSLFDKWWGLFLKWVYFGPIALLFMVIIVKITDATTSGADSKPAGSDLFNSDYTSELVTTETFAEIAGIFVIGGLIIAATMAGKALGMIGAAASLSFAKGVGDKAKQYSVAGAKTAAKVASAPVVAPTKWVGKQVKYQAQDAGRAITSNIADRYVPRWLKPVKRDKNGKPLSGQPQSLLEKAANKMPLLGKKMSSAQQGRVNAAAAVAKNADGRLTNPGDVNHPALAATNLRDPEVKRALGKEAIIHDVMLNADNIGQIEAVVNDKAFMDGLSDNEKITLLNNIHSNTNVLAGTPIPTVPELAAKGITDPDEVKMVRSQVAAQGSLAAREAKAKIMSKMMDAINKAAPPT